MTVRELISKKDYEWISFRVTVPDHWECDDEYHSEFFGVCHSENGKLIPDDGDIYDEDEELVAWWEWSNDEYGIKNGLTVVEKGEWYTPNGGVFYNVSGSSQGS